jgi:hypothetical protein
LRRELPLVSGCDSSHIDFWLSSFPVSGNQHNQFGRQHPAIWAGWFPETGGSLKG